VATEPRAPLARPGKPEEARQVLSEVYALFTEGFDAPDLKAARAVLDAVA
jgi:adenylate cyclase